MRRKLTRTVLSVLIVVGAVLAVRWTIRAAMTRAYRARRDVIVAGINAIPGLSARTPEGAFYLFVNVRGSGLTSERFAMRLLEEGRVALSPGSAFGPSGEGYARISYASSIDNLKKGLARIEGFMRRL